MFNRFTLLNIGIWDFRNPGFTAIAHPASIGVAENHGVFILEDMSTLWKSYKIGMCTKHVNALSLSVYTEYIIPLY